MKVICIRDNWNIAPDCLNPPIPKVGNVYTVVESDVVDGDIFYSLKGFSGYQYDASFFIPLSSISETEMERDYNKVTQ